MRIREGREQMREERDADLPLERYTIATLCRAWMTVSFVSPRTDFIIGKACSSSGKAWSYCSKDANKTPLLFNAWVR